MSIFKKTKKRVYINNQLKEVIYPTNVLNLTQFYIDAASMGATIDKVLFEKELLALPSIAKDEATFILVPGVYKEGMIYGLNPDTGTIEEFTFSRSTAATYIDKSGKIQIAPADMPRIDYDPNTGEALGYLLEAARTNLALYSGGGEYGSLQVVYTSDRQFTSRQISQGKSCLYFEGENAVSSGTFRLSSIGLVEGKTYTWSFWVRADQQTTRGFANYKGSSYNTSSFNITTSWTRVVFTFVAEGNYDLPHMSKPTGTTSNFYIADIQCEEGDTATSYIPTLGTTVLRTRDYLRSVNDLVPYQNASVFMHMKSVILNDISSAITLLRGNTDGRYWYTLVSAPFSVSAYSSTSGILTPEGQSTATQYNKMVVSYGTDGFKAAINGGKTMTKAYAGTFGISGSLVFATQGVAALLVKQVAIQPRQLTDSEHSQASA
ncbi:carbohydrate binding domain-containing protein [Pedobacter antarcticus]|uniref:phage head spike fiber domain-containing protein n=1 Tax=Pedobacter antarcticus TaxID=34086 RepID=UPI00293170FE|nr:carbohydrate binding domain-containing protein [Pedobacter antarcticus]